MTDNNTFGFAIPAGSKASCTFHCQTYLEWSYLWLNMWKESEHFQKRYESFPESYEMLIHDSRMLMKPSRHLNILAVSNHKSIIFLPNFAIMTSLFESWIVSDCMTHWHDRFPLRTDPIPPPTFPTTFMIERENRAMFHGKTRLAWRHQIKNTSMSHLHSSNSFVQVWTRKSHV